MLEPWQLGLVTLIMALAATVQGSVGFGMALLAAPLLVLMDPRFVPAPLMLAGLALTVLVALRERRNLDFKRIGWILAGRVPGAGLGALLLVLMPPEHVGPTLAVVVLLAVAMTASGLRLPETRPTLFGAGITSGIMGTSAAIGGPPVALVLQRSEGASLRGTLSGYFIFSSLISLLALRIAGLFSFVHVQLGLVLLPGLFFGFLFSQWTRHLLDRGYTRPAVLLLSSLAAVGLLLRQW